MKSVPDDHYNKNGQLIWKSAKFPGAGFHSYWPVIFTDKTTGRDYVIFSGSQNIHDCADLFSLDRDVLFPNHQIDPWGTLISPTGVEPGDWASGTITLDVSKITNYLEHMSGHRVVFVLDTENGQEFTFDSNSNGLQEYIPFTWAGTTHSGNKYPPLIGIDGVIYQFANYVSAPWITRGQIAGWKFGTHFISKVAGSDLAVDEPMAYAAGGRIIYWSLCNDRASGAFDITIPENQPNRKWDYFIYTLRKLVPGYQPKYYGNDFNGWGLFGGINGIYGKHGAQNPPIPYMGKVFMQKGNSIIAFSPTGGPPTQLPMAATISIPKTTLPVSLDELKQKLEAQVQKIVNNPSTFLRPGFHGTGFFNSYLNIDGDRLIEYFHNPSDTLNILCSALPYLSTDLQDQTKLYLLNFFTRFPTYNIVSTGWVNGLPREVFDMPPEVPSYVYSGPATTSISGTWWQSFPPDFFMALGNMLRSLMVLDLFLIL